MGTTASLLADTICRTVELGVTITDAAVEGDLAQIAAAPVRRTRCSCLSAGVRKGVQSRSAGEIADMDPSLVMAHLGG